MARVRSTVSKKSNKSVYKRKATKKYSKPTKQFTKMVQSIVSRNIENKIRQANLSMDCIVAQNNGATEFSGLFPLTPYDSTGAPIGGTLSILQGTSSSTRVGNQIRTKRATLKGVMYPMPINTTTNPAPKILEVCMWIFKLKNIQSGCLLIDATGVLDQTFFQDSGSSIGITGSIMDIVREVNRDQVILLKKRVFKVGVAAGQQGGSLANNDFKYNQKFNIDITKYIPKVIKYNDNTDEPSINHTYCYIAPYYADGTVPVDVLHKPLHCDLEVVYQYEDA